MIRGNRIILRTLREEDIEPFYALFSDIERRGPWYPQDFGSIVEIQRRYHDDGLWSDAFGRLLICTRDAGRMVGTIRYGRDQTYHDSLEIGFLIFDFADRGKGYMTEAVMLLVKYLFATRSINRIQISFFPENQATRQVATKCGFTGEGIARRAVFHRGRHWDIENYAILRDQVELD